MRSIAKAIATPIFFLAFLGAMLFGLPSMACAIEDSSQSIKGADNVLVNQDSAEADLTVPTGFAGVCDDASDTVANDTVAGDGAASDGAVEDLVDDLVGNDNPDAAKAPAAPSQGGSSSTLPASDDESPGEPLEDSPSAPPATSPDLTGISSTSAFVSYADKLAKQYADALPDDVYAIRSDLLIKLVLDASGQGSGNATAVQVYNANETLSQLWRVSHDSKGYVTFTHVKTGMVLDVQSGSAKDGTKVQLHASNGTKAQKWIAVPCGQAFKLVSALSTALALEVENAEASNSTLVQVGYSNDTTAQRWHFTYPGKAETIASLTCGDNAIVPVALGYGDYALALPSHATSSSTYLALGKDIAIGSNASIVKSGTKFAISDYFSEALEDLASFVVRDLEGNAFSNLYIVKSANLTSIFVVSEDPEEHGRTWVESSPDHSNSAKGTVDVVASDGESIYDGKLSQIKGRGNSSWSNFKKKPFQIKLDKKTDLLQTGDKANKSKTWLLISDEYDGSSSKNLLAYSYAKLLGLSSAIDCAMVDFYYDGEYRGTYLLCEKVQVGSGRVDIEDLEDSTEQLNPNIDEASVVKGLNSYGMEISYGEGLSNPSDISGGYLIEQDERYAQESSWFYVWDGYAYQHFVCKSPEVWSYEEADYMSCLIQDLFDAFNNNGVVPDLRGSSRAGMTTAELLDVDSLARLYWVNELLKNSDGLTFASNFLYKDSDGADGSASPIYFGPAWDFDRSCGVGHAGPEASGWYTRTMGLATSFLNDPYASRAIEDTAAEAIAILREYLNGGDFADAMEACRASLKGNDIVWKLEGLLVGSPDFLAYNWLYDWNVDKTYEEVADWVNQRIDWIEANC